jgi:myo-inositol-1(or 4)-monophosphatase
VVPSIDLIPGVLDVVHRAGVIIEEVRRSGMEVAHKRGDQGPVTRADREADALLKTDLLKLLPAAWLSEETADDRARLTAERVWIVDPLDGTKDFVAGIPEYSVAVALVERGEPVLGVVHNPATMQTVWAVRGEGAYVGQGGGGRGKGNRATVSEGNRLLASRSETKRGEFEPFRASWDVVPVGSIEWKLAMVAMGQGAVTVSRGPKHEWDVCAGALLVREAGGLVSEALGGPLAYNRARPKVAGILAGAPQAHRRLLVQVKEIGASDRMAELNEE